LFSTPLSQLLRGDIAGFVGVVVSLIVAITVHEFSHAAAATWLGDPLPGRQGRLTLSPAAHLDPIGSLLILVAGMGWGRPVQYNPYALRAGPRSGPMLVALAGPVSNLLLAAFFSIIVRALDLGMSGVPAIADLGFISVLLGLFAQMVFFNLILAFFNLIPIFPLDGFSVLLGLLPPDLAFRYEQTRSWGMFVLFALFFFGGPVLSLLLYRPVNLLFQLLIGF